MIIFQHFFSFSISFDLRFLRAYWIGSINKNIIDIICCDEINVFHWQKRYIFPNVYIRP